MNKQILTAVLNSPRLLNRFPMVDSIEIKHIANNEIMDWVGVDVIIYIKPKQRVSETQNDELEDFMKELLRDFGYTRSHVFIDMITNGRTTIIEIFTALFNSPLLKDKFPFIDRIVISFMDVYRKIGGGYFELYVYVKPGTVVDYKDDMRLKEYVFEVLNDIGFQNYSFKIRDWRETND